jgi:hypothetical protein
MSIALLFMIIAVLFSDVTQIKIIYIPICIVSILVNLQLYRWSQIQHAWA